MKRTIPSLALHRYWLYSLLLFFGLLNNTVSAQISGTAFRDFDSDGSLSPSVATPSAPRSGTAPVENGIGGILVRAYLEQNTVPITTVTTANGSYSFSSALIPPNSRVRLEFANWPTGYHPSPHDPAGGGTTVQFVRAPASDVNVGINYPSDYCQPVNIKMVTPCFVNGDPLKTTDDNGPIPTSAQAGQTDALVAFDYDAFTIKGAGNASANASQFPADHLAMTNQVGSVWGLGLQRRTKLLFSAAVVKRHAGFGPLGTGGIYVTDLKSTTPNATTPFLSLPDDLGIPTGADPHSGLPGNKLFPSADPGPMQAMGRIGLGGADMSEDDRTLFVLNLFDRKVYGLEIGIPAQKPNPSTGVKSWALTGPGCPQGEFRPWALKVYRGKVYVGGVCSGEYAPTDVSSFVNAVSSPLLSAHIYELDPSVTGSQFQSVLSFPLSFARGSADLTGDCINFKYWQPWTDQFPVACNTNFVMWPQPMLTDIEFDVDGHMIIGMLDRFGHLAGVANHDPNGNGYYDGFTGGDLLRAAPTGGNQFTIENNGVVGDRTSVNGVGNSQGPGGGEFYSDDAWIFQGRVAHDEINNGALTLIPGKNEIVSSAYDPITDIYKSAGWKIHNNLTGQSGRGFLVIIDDPGTFGKASGLGDSKPICDPAPVEIGNRVWYDDNRNGLQDAYEPGIDGLVISLYDGTALVASTTTVNGGQWYFNNANVPGGLLFQHNYQVRMAMSQLNAYDLTATTQRARSNRTSAREAVRVYALGPYQTNTGTDSGIRDSDAQMVSGDATINVLTGDAGQNNQTYDISVTSCPIIETQSTQLSVCQGETVSSISVKGTYLAVPDKVKFVCFDTKQTDPTVIYSATNVLGVVTPSSSSTVSGGGVLVMIDRPTIATNTNASSATFKYVYAIVEATPPLSLTAGCLPFDEIVITILPKPKVNATGGTITCNQPSVTLTASLTDEQNQPIASGTYYWTGPNSFSSNAQNPVVSTAGAYTLVAAAPNCPSATVSTTALVDENVTVPIIVDAYGEVPTCSTCTATISATVSPETASLLWLGPNSYTSNQATNIVSEPGFYTLIVTGSSGCSAQTEVEVPPGQDEDPCPIITRGGPVSVCAGSPLPPLSVTVVATGTYAVSQIRFLYSATKLINPAEAYSGSLTTLGTVAIVNGVATLSNPAVPTANTFSKTIYRYVYAILEPAPFDPTCRPVAELVIQINGTNCVPVQAQRLR